MDVFVINFFINFPQLFSSDRIWSIRNMRNGSPPAGCPHRSSQRRCTPSPNISLKKISLTLSYRKNTHVTWFCCFCPLRATIVTPQSGIRPFLAGISMAIITMPKFYHNILTFMFINFSLFSFFIFPFTSASFTLYKELKKCSVICLSWF